MGRSRPNLPRCAGQLTNACELSMQRYRSNGSSTRPETSGLGGIVLDLRGNPGGRRLPIRLGDCWRKVLESCPLACSVVNAGFHDEARATVRGS